LGRVSARLPNGREMRLITHEHESVTSAVYWLGWTGEEPHTIPIWYDLAKDACTIIDVGAHIGHHTIVAGLANPAATLHAFEPLPRVAEMLRKNIELNGLNVQVYETAVGRGVGTGVLYAVSSGPIPSSSSMSVDFRDMNPILDDEVPVSITSIDETISEVRPPVLIKIDTESTEPDVIYGARELIRRYSPVIILEILPGPESSLKVEQELRNIGYEYTPYLLTESGPVKKDRISSDAVWHNYLLMPNLLPIN